MDGKFKLANQNAIVTGAAKGIGKHIALALAEAGANVGIVDLDLDAANEVAEEIIGMGRKGVAIFADVSDEIRVRQMAFEAKEAFGTIDVLVNNAGIALSFPAVEMAFQDWNSVIETNLTGAFLCSKGDRKGDDHGQEGLDHQHLVGGLFGGE
jgi:NAD(P)-dependent dehydrogenase (short-subunit alcohol dehydrogenase family)